jgi:diguanylate cyclase (GGDEF)-like protein
MLAISAKISLAIENALTFRQVESSASTDFLTGLPNARSLFLRLNSELARSRRSADPIAVLVCDLDGFKQINDRFGHLEGNRALRLMADAFKRHCRGYDYVARMGGDEFVVVLAGGNRSATYHRITELSEAVRAVGKSVFGITTLSLSVGEAFYPEDGCDAEELLAEADRRMYKTKHGNRSNGHGQLPQDVLAEQLE